MDIAELVAIETKVVSAADMIRLDDVSFEGNCVCFKSLQTVVGQPQFVQARVEHERACRNKCSNVQGCSSMYEIVLISSFNTCDSVSLDAISLCYFIT